MTSKRLILGSAALLVVALFLFDLRTEREVVVAIAYAVPVALSSLARSPRWTLLTTGAALLATLGAGLEDALSEGLSAASLINQALAALSFTLVGTFALVLGRSSARVGELERGEGRAEREADLRHLLMGLSYDDTPHTLLTHAVGGLQRLFGATKVVISATQGGRLAAPHYSSAPRSGGDLSEGRLTPWVAALRASGTRVASARLDGQQLTVGWLRRPGKAALLVLVARPRAAEPCVLLNEVLDGLEPLLEHAERLEDRAWSPQAPTERR